LEADPLEGVGELDVDREVVRVQLERVPGAQPLGLAHVEDQTRDRALVLGRQLEPPVAVGVGVGLEPDRRRGIGGCAHRPSLRRGEPPCTHRSGPDVGRSAAQYAFARTRRPKAVSATIFRSKKKLYRRMYSMSCATRWIILSSVSVSPRQPLTCAQPVIPGFILWRSMYSRIFVRYCWLCATACGRGPTTDISPRSTLTNCGTSSSEVRRRKEPTRVTRVAPARACLTSAPFSRTRIVRNLKTRISWPSRP